MLPDIGVLGPYTYLATEVLWGSIALGLLVYTGAVRRAAKTVALLYPVAYVWDWYTLTVGVFAIPLRTGIELLGIPIEEHIFMIVVPSLVVGAHELLHGPPASADTDTVDPRSTSDSGAIDRGGTEGSAPEDPSPVVEADAGSGGDEARTPEPPQADSPTEDASTVD